MGHLLKGTGGGRRRRRARTLGVDGPGAASVGAAFLYLEIAAPAGRSRSFADSEDRKLRSNGSEERLSAIDKAPTASSVLTSLKDISHPLM